MQHNAYLTLETFNNLFYQPSTIKKYVVFEQFMISFFLGV